MYPIKSLRGIPLTNSKVVDTGLEYDRTFMLLKVDNGPEGRIFKNMHVTRFTEMSLFKTSMSGNTVTVSYSGPKNDPVPETSIEIPLLPDMSSLKLIDVEMHKSSTKAYEMGDQYKAWFTKQFGYDVLLAYIGPKRRPVLGSLMPAIPSAQGVLSSWLPTALGGKNEELKTHGITFADCAHFLIVTEESLGDCSARLPVGIEMDIRKFRPNVVLTGSPAPWDEDYWGAINIHRGNDDGEGINMPLTANCIRCTSINIDYETGKPGKGEEGKMLKKLMGDRRVDKGAKYSPIFGRYGYLGEGLGKTINIGDEVEVTKRLTERTTWGELLVFMFASFADEWQTGRCDDES